MQRDIEVFMPTLFPVVLESKTRTTTADAPILADLDLSAFSGFAREELTMATRRLGESARALTAKGEKVTGAKLTVLAAPYNGFETGTLACVATTPTERTAYLAYGTEADPKNGYVLLPRNVIALAPRKQLLMAAGPKTTGDKTADEMVKLAKMAQAKLPPGPVGTAVGVVLGLVDFFSSEGPSEAEIIIAAIKTAIDAAVVELETFMVQQQMQMIETVIIGDAYDLIKEIEALARSKTTVEDQVIYARTAVKDMKTHIDLLRPWCKMLPKITLPDAGANMHARAKALRLLAYGATALFTLMRLRLQFNAFLAMNETSANKRATCKSEMHDDFARFQIAVFGQSSDLPMAPGADGARDAFSMGPDSMLSIYAHMRSALLMDRAGRIDVKPVSNLGSFAWTRGKLVDPYQKIDQDLNAQDWKNFLASVGLPAVLLEFDDTPAIAAQRQSFISVLVNKWAAAEGMQANLDALAEFFDVLRDWRDEVIKWQAIDVHSAPMQVH